MNSFKNRTQRIAALRFFAICASAIPFAVQKVCGGSFTLPQEVCWQDATFSAGEYTFLITSVLRPDQIAVHGPNGFALVSAPVADPDRVSDCSVMTIEHRGGTSVVRELYLAPIGLRLKYAAPKIPKDQELAQGPGTIEQVPVAVKV